MDKIEVITKHLQGKPEEKSGVTWIEFLQVLNTESEQEMYDAAINLMRGHFFYIGGYTYFLTGVNVRE